MDLVRIPDLRPRRLAFYLAVEEMVCTAYPGRDLFFAWQVDPTVIIGRNQQLRREVDVDFCRERGIDVVRRRSGGGAVLADRNNVMFSHITPWMPDVASSYRTYTSLICGALRSLGLDASASTRNDILIGTRKVAGNSYYRHPSGTNIVHGTMLYDCDAELMGRILSPSTAKLQSHGVASVRSRITTVKEHLPSLPLDEFLARMHAAIPFGSVVTLTEADIAEAERLEEAYYEPEWLIGRNPRGEVHASKRYEGIGELTVDITLHRGVIADIQLTGDYMESADASRALAEATMGLPYSRPEVASALERGGVASTIPGLDTEKLVNLIF